MKKQKQNPLINKTRATFSIENELNRYLSQVSKDTGYTRTAIVEELLRQNLYPIHEHPKFSPIMRALDYRKDMILLGK